jgi:hypothetical protein
VKDLGNVFESFTAGTPVVWVGFTWNASGVITAWVPDRDYLLVGVMSNIAMILSTNSTVTFTNIGGTTTGPRSDILFIHGNTNFPCTALDLAVPLKQSTKYWLVSNGGGCAVLYLKP